MERVVKVDDFFHSLESLIIYTSPRRYHPFNILPSPPGHILCCQYFPYHPRHLLVLPPYKLPANGNRSYR